MRTPLLVLMLVASTILAGCLGGPDDDLVTPPVLEGPLGLGPVEGLSRLLPVGSFEPTIAVSASGAIFMTAGAGSIGPTMENVYRSTDHGLTWEDVTANLAGVSNYPPNSNDPLIFLDKDTNRLYDFEMQGLSCNMLAYSDDDGENWTPSPIGCTPTQGIQDHQTLFASKPRVLETVGYPNVLHYCINRVADSGCAFSLDGGMTWGPMRGLVYSGLNAPGTPVSGSGGTPGDLCGGLHAHGQAAPDGTIYLPRDYCGTPMVAISEDDGLTWTLVTISDDTPVIGHSHEVSMAIDEAGNAYAAWIGDDKRVKFAQSGDGGWTWDDAIDITPEGVNMTDFPTIAAGAEGRVAVAFIGSDTNATDDEGEAIGYGDVPWDAHWNAWIVTGIELQGDNATWSNATANDPEDPIARGVCGATRCQASGGGLGDFIDIEIDHQGRPWAAFVDACHEECRKVTEEPAEECGDLPVVSGCSVPGINDEALGMVGTLNTGPALRGGLVALDALEVKAVLAPA